MKGTCIFLDSYVQLLDLNASSLTSAVEAGVSRDNIDIRFYYQASLCTK